MTPADATIIAAIIAAGAAVISVVASLFVARATVRGKLKELEQAQIGDIIRKRIACYPSLWNLCQENITRPMFEEHHTDVLDNWASTLSDKLEAWHTKNGAFLSQSSYEALHLLRKKARIGAVKWNTAAAAHGLHPEPDVNVPYNSGEKSPLGELEKIWTTGFTYKGKQHDPLATCLKNDLGSYAQAVFSK
jgi:hypothetical protein